MEIAERHDPAERHEGEHRRPGHLAEEIRHDRRQRAERLVAIQHDGHLREQKLKPDEHHGHRGDDDADALQRVHRENDRGPHHDGRPVA